ncbi:hypothetical protein G6011_00158 [Alternaria panax]|uniref:Uncharacterized protein n=1 Tax=Alternaria panax TaxID=48097 RepID=A0AAD4NUR1_9PLEO|nr:hypothetical protein G6011_00158 [Alternaria panax]
MNPPSFNREEPPAACIPQSTVSNSGHLLDDNDRNIDDDRADSDEGDHDDDMAGVPQHEDSLSATRENSQLNDHSLESEDEEQTEIHSQIEGDEQVSDDGSDVNMSGSRTPAKETGSTEDEPTEGDPRDNVEIARKRLRLKPRAKRRPQEHDHVALCDQEDPLNSPTGPLPELVPNIASLPHPCLKRRSFDPKNGCPEGGWWNGEVHSTQLNIIWNGSLDLGTRPERVCGSNWMERNSQPTVAHRIRNLNSDIVTMTKGEKLRIWVAKERMI